MEYPSKSAKKLPHLAKNGAFRAKKWAKYTIVGYSLVNRFKFQLIDIYKVTSGSKVEK
jgi:hypothetical protein